MIDPVDATAVFCDQLLELRDQNVHVPPDTASFVASVILGDKNNNSLKVLFRKALRELWNGVIISRPGAGGISSTVTDYSRLIRAGIVCAPIYNRWMANPRKDGASIYSVPVYYLSAVGVRIFPTLCAAAGIEGTLPAFSKEAWELIPAMLASPSESVAILLDALPENLRKDPPFSEYVYYDAEKEDGAFLISRAETVYVSHPLEHAIRVHRTQKEAERAVLSKIQRESP